jgi:hypothetical protein
MNIDWQIDIAKGFFDLRVRELGKIRGVVVQDEDRKRFSVCVEWVDDMPDGKKVTVFPYGCVYIVRDRILESVSQ